MPLEDKAIYAFATSHGHYLSEQKFQQQYGLKPDAQGNEQLVYISADGKYVIKVNDGAYHGTWLELFDRLALHNFLFPETAYELIGFTKRKGFHGEDRFAIILKQPFVQAEMGADLEEVKKDMAMRDFRHLKGNDFYNPGMGLVIEDLHDENVIFNSGRLIYIDPVIYLETKDMQLDGKNLFKLF